MLRRWRNYGLFVICPIVASILIASLGRYLDDTGLEGFLYLAVLWLFVAAPVGAVALIVIELILLLRRGSRRSHEAAAG